MENKLARHNLSCGVLCVNSVLPLKVLFRRNEGTVFVLRLV